MARGSTSVPPRPAPAAPAATIVLMRDAGGLEVLLLRRTSAAGFVPGAYVFPGGRVDAADADPAILERVDGLDAAEAATRLDLPNGNPPAIAYYVAALREAFEETGILVSTRPTDEASAPPRRSQVARTRNELMEDRIGFGAVLRQFDCRVAADRLEYLAHWVTPDSEPVRFDTRFFAAGVDRHVIPVVDAREMTEALWVRPGKALAERARGRLPMILPTVRTLEQISSYDSVAGALEAMSTARVPRIQPPGVTTPMDVGLRSAEDP